MTYLFSNVSWLCIHNIPRHFKESGQLGRFINITAIFLLLLLFHFELSLQTHLKQIFSFGFKILSNKIQPIRLKWRKKSSKILQSYLVSPVLAEMFMKMKSEENEKIEIPIYVNISARAGERNYFYQISIKRKQAIPLQDSELF